MWEELRETGLGLLVTPLIWTFHFWPTDEEWRAGNLAFELGPVTILVQLPAGVFAREPK